MHHQPGNPSLIRSVQRALRLLEVVAERQGQARAKELSRAAGFNLATTYHLLRTLTSEGYLRRLDDHSYALGPRLDAALRRCGTARAAAQAGFFSATLELWPSGGRSPAGETESSDADGPGRPSPSGGGRPPGRIDHE